MSGEKNHLIIGLGGTGGKIIASFRKVVYQNFRDLNPDQMNIDYLYVDSSQSDLDQKDESIWEVLGTDLRLDEGSLFNIKTGLTEYFFNLAAFPNVKHWAGNESQWAHISNNTKLVDGAAGQIRKLGRLLFASKAEKFKTTVDVKISHLESKLRQNKATIHIVCGLAGGTGSGTILDVISLIREKRRNPNDYKIIVYALLPEKNPTHSWAKANYHANGYAALKELNALSTGHFKPHDLSSSSTEPNRLDNHSPFYGCYVFSNINENGVKVDVQNELPGIVADFLYQKIRASIGRLRTPNEIDGSKFSSGSWRRIFDSICSR